MLIHIGMLSMIRCTRHTLSCTQTNECMLDNDQIEMNMLRDTSALISACHSENECDDEFIEKAKELLPCIIDWYHKTLSSTKKQKIKESMTDVFDKTLEKLKNCPLLTDHCDRRIITILASLYVAEMFDEITDRMFAYKTDKIRYNNMNGKTVYDHKKYNHINSKMKKMCRNEIKKLLKYNILSTDNTQGISSDEITNVNVLIVYLNMLKVDTYAISKRYVLLRYINSVPDAVYHFWFFLVSFVLSFLKMGRTNN